VLEVLAGHPVVVAVEIVRVAGMCFQVGLRVLLIDEVLRAVQVARLSDAGQGQRRRDGDEQCGDRQGDGAAGGADGHAAADPLGDERQVRDVIFRWRPRTGCRPVPTCRYPRICGVARVVRISRKW
jgi:hypothetical protein